MGCSSSKEIQPPRGFQQVRTPHQNEARVALEWAQNNIQAVQQVAIYANLYAWGVMDLRSFEKKSQRVLAYAPRTVVAMYVTSSAAQRGLEHSKLYVRKNPRVTCPVTLGLSQEHMYHVKKVVGDYTGVNNRL